MQQPCEHKAENLIAVFAGLQALAVEIAREKAVAAVCDAKGANQHHDQVGADGDRNIFHHAEANADERHHKGDVHPRKRICRFCEHAPGGQELHCFLRQGEYNERMQRLIQERIHLPQPGQSQGYRERSGYSDHGERTQGAFSQRFAAKLPICVVLPKAPQPIEQSRSGGEAQQIAQNRDDH